MAKADTYFNFFSRWLASDRPNEKGEYRALCPLHNESRPSASINFDKGVFACMAPSCIGGTSLRQLKAMVLAKEADDNADVAAYNPFADNDGNVIDIKTRSKVSSAEPTKVRPVTEGLVRAWCRGMAEEETARARFKTKRGLTDVTIKEFEIGYNIGKRAYTIPIRDASGTLVNVRSYMPDDDAAQKMANWPGLGSPPRLYPFAVLQDSETILVVEGELDALIAIQNGFPAVSGTGGAGRWSVDWSKLFEGKKVYFSYDNDAEGRIGAKKAAASVAKYASEVYILDPLLPDENKSDITDYFTAGGTPEGLREVMAHATPYAAVARDQAATVGATPATVEVIGSMDSTTNGKPLEMTVTVIGKKNPTYSFPRKAELSCTMDAGPKCKNCVMLLSHEGDTDIEVAPRDVETLARFIDAPEDGRVEVARGMIGAQKCNRLKMKVTEPQSVEELFVANSIEHRNTDASDYTQRRMYNVGAHDTPTNSVARLEGTTWPNVKNSRNEFFSWSLEPATTSIDSFVMTPEIAQQLRIFQPPRGQKPIDKAREIAEDLAQVTGIIGRERMQMAMDLVWHSALRFRFGGKLLNRGWLEFIVVGDTRTGKSETAMRLADHYGLGHVIGCEGASFAGLVGGVKQVGNEWTITWGEIPINDRRLVILDEFGGLSYDIISQLSDIRARGVAQVTKVETYQTLARCRMIAIANPRKSKFIDEKKVDGIDIIQDVVGNEEDIARFDFAMSVRAGDVPSEAINRRQAVGEPKYSAEACHNLILWAWSRKPEQVVWAEGSEDTIYKAANWLGQRYIETPPLLQVQASREKLARMSVALAARVFSTDPTYERIVVMPQHVRDAVNFLDKLYSYDNFGYRRVSERIMRNRRIAVEQRENIRKYLLENKRILEFLMDKHGSFRAQDLEEMAFMGREEVNMALGRLADAKMISKVKSQIVMEPELQDLLKEIEKGMQ
jgi:hypothetical protein